MSNLSVTGTGVDTASVSWGVAYDAESGISEYRAYRDGSFIDSTSATAYTATALPASTNYEFEIAAVNGDGIEGNKVSISATTKAQPGGSSGGGINDSRGAGSTDLIFLMLLDFAALRVAGIRRCSHRRST